MQILPRFVNGIRPLFSRAASLFVADSDPVRPRVPEWRGLARQSVAVFGRQILVFPLLVVLLACLSFFFGGRTAAWQWWTAVGVVLLAPFLRIRRWKAALIAAGFFSGVLVVLKGALPPALWDNAGCIDVTTYHLPMAQLLIEGWNPVSDPLAEGIAARMGLDLWGMAPLHVAFLPKTLAVFAAVAYTFVGDPVGLTIPALAILWLGVALQAVRQFRGMARWAVVAALVWILPLVDKRMYADLSLAFASCGLLFALADALKRGRCDWLAAGIWTTWMATIKLNGVLAAVVFWSLFAGAMLWRERQEWRAWLGRFALLGLAVASLSAVVVWNPYMTSWRTYGHPLYPFKTADSERFPVQDPTWDMRYANDDYRDLGCAGLWLYHFVSPDWAVAAGRRLTGRENFTPKSPWYWSQYVNQNARRWLWVLFAVLLLHPRGRIWCLSGVLLTLFVPWEKIGYLRYQPWLSGLGCLAVALLCESLLPRPRRWLKTILACVLVWLATDATADWLWENAGCVVFKMKETALVRERIHCNFWASGRKARGVNPDDFAPRIDYLSMMENRCRLFAKEMGWSRAEVLPADGWVPQQYNAWRTDMPLWQLDERQWFAPEGEKDMRFLEETGTPWQGWDPRTGPMNYGNDAEKWVLTPWEYWVPLADRSEHVLEYFSNCFARRDESRWAWLSRTIGPLTRTWLLTYPQEAWKWLSRKNLENRP